MLNFATPLTASSALPRSRCAVCEPQGWEDFVVAMNHYFFFPHRKFGHKCGVCQGLYFKHPLCLVGCDPCPLCMDTAYNLCSPWLQDLALSVWFFTVVLLNSDN